MPGSHKSRYRELVHCECGSRWVAIRWPSGEWTTEERDPEWHKDGCKQGADT